MIILRRLFQQETCESSASAPMKKLSKQEQNCILIGLPVTGRFGRQ